MPEYDKKVDDPLDVYVFRPIANSILPAFRTMHFTPTLITWVSILFAVCSFICFIFGYLKLAALAYLIYYILDCTDGQYARRYQLSSTYGAVLDWNKDHLIGIFFSWAFLYSDWMSGIALIFSLFITGLSYAALDIFTDSIPQKPLQKNLSIFQEYYFSSHITKINIYQFVFQDKFNYSLKFNIKFLRWFGTGSITVIFFFIFMLNCFILIHTFALLGILVLIILIGNRYVFYNS